MIPTIKQDYENLLSDETFKEAALEQLQNLQDFDDRTATRATNPLNPDDPNSDFEIEEIENPLPLHKQKGFEEWMDVVRLNAEARGVKVSDLTEEYSKTEIEAAVVVLT
jgi:hypothetical protein